MRSLASGLVSAAVVASACLSCASTWHSLADSNRALLDALVPGQPAVSLGRPLEVQSHRIDEGEGTRAIDVPNPFRVVSIRLRDGGDAWVAYFYTRRVAADGIVAEDELTPVVVRGGLVEAVGRQQLRAIADPDSLEAAAADNLESEIEAARGEGRTQRGVRLDAILEHEDRVEREYSEDELR